MVIVSPLQKENFETANCNSSFSHKAVSQKTQKLVCIAGCLEELVANSS